VLRRLPLTLALALALLLAWPARAQEDSGLIHIVQPGENLFRIALRYGVTVEAIAAANGIADQRTIYVGQELRIPGVGSPALTDLDEGVSLVNHVVQPGDTLLTLAKRYGTTIERLAEINCLVNGGRIFVGQTLTVAQGSAGLPVTRGRIYAVHAGDTLLTVARHHGVTSQAVAQANNLGDVPLLFPGQCLVIPGGDAAPALVELPDPILDITIDPLPAAQGQTIGLRVHTSRPAVVTGAFMGRPINLSSPDGLAHGAVFGIHALTERGLYPLMIFARDRADNLSYLNADVLVVETDHNYEEIDVPARLQGLLDPAITQPEMGLLASAMTAFNPERYWQGVFTNPVVGNVTSSFGAQRSYGGGELETFHAGVDFGVPAGTPIYAPAPGRVVLAQELTVRGNATIIDHGWSAYTGYWHLSQIDVEVGQMVRGRQLIGRVGSTGLSTGPHLHWEMWVSGVQVDPMQWVRHAFP
jgi:murein DD-endopeptidase MepM/ murein hydrolase activator NlpD